MQGLALAILVASSSMFVDPSRRRWPSGKPNTVRQSSSPCRNIAATFGRLASHFWAISWPRRRHSCLSSPANTAARLVLRGESGNAIHIHGAAHATEIPRRGDHSEPINLDSRSA